MGRTSVSLSLDEETLEIWKRIPLKQRSAVVREHLRALPMKGNPESTYSVFEPQRVQENDDSKVGSRKPHASKSVIELLLELPKNPKEDPIFQKRKKTRGFDLFDDLFSGLYK